MMRGVYHTFSVELIAALNSHNLDRITALYAPETEEIDIGQASPKFGANAVRQTITRLLHAFPDFHFHLDENIIENNRVVITWTFRATHRGTYMNIPATNRPVEVRGVSILTVENNKITRLLRIWDTAGMLRSMGLLPELT